MRYILLASIATMAFATSAQAQDYFIREQLHARAPVVGNPDPSTPTPTPTPAPTPEPPQQASWSTGEWGSWSTDCGDSAMRTRPVTCMKGRVAVDDSQCTQNRPESTQGPSPRYGSCEYSWKNGYINTVSDRTWCTNGTMAYRVISACFKKDTYQFASRESDSRCQGLAKPETQVVNYGCTNLGATYNNGISNGSALARNFEVKYFNSIMTSIQAREAGQQMCADAAMATYGPTPTSAANCVVRRWATNASQGQTVIEAGLIDQNPATSSYPTGTGWTNGGTSGTGRWHARLTIKVSKTVELPSDYTLPCGTQTSSPYWGTVC